MKNITIVAVLAAMMALGALVACGGGTPAPAAPDPGAAAAGAANSAAAGASSAAPATSK